MLRRKVRSHEVDVKDFPDILRLRLMRFYVGDPRDARAVHERPDGSGFPDGVAAPRIPLGSLIISIANTYDAMTTMSEFLSMPVMNAASPIAARRLPWPQPWVTAYSPT